MGSLSAEVVAQRKSQLAATGTKAEELYLDTLVQDIEEEVEQTDAWPKQSKQA